MFPLVQEHYILSALAWHWSRWPKDRKISGSARCLVCHMRSRNWIEQYQGKHFSVLSHGVFFLVFSAFQKVSSISLSDLCPSLSGHRCVISHCSCRTHYSCWHLCRGGGVKIIWDSPPWSGLSAYQIWFPVDCINLLSPRGAMSHSVLVPPVQQLQNHVSEMLQQI